MNNNEKPFFKNPHLEGDSFLLPGNDTCILLIHGYTATTAEIRLLANALHDYGYTVAGTLLPGHGTFPEDANRYTWKDWTESVERAYAELKPKCTNIIVGGESTGGLLALYLAAKHPEIKAIITYAPALKLSLSLAARIFLIVASYFVPYIKKKKKKDDLLWQGYIVYPLKGVRQLMHLENHVRQSLTNIHQPLLIVQGKLDKTVHPDTPEMIAKSVSSDVVEVHWMEKSAHCVVLDKEHDKVAEITQSFLKQILNSP